MNKENPSGFRKTATIEGEYESGGEKLFALITSGAFRKSILWCARQTARSGLESVFEVYWLGENRLSFVGCLGSCDGTVTVGKTPPNTAEDFEFQVVFDFHFHSEEEGIIVPSIDSEVGDLKALRQIRAFCSKWSEKQQLRFYPIMAIGRVGADRAINILLIQQVSDLLFTSELAMELSSELSKAKTQDEIVGILTDYGYICGMINLDRKANLIDTNAALLVMKRFRPY